MIKAISFTDPGPEIFKLFYHSLDEVAPEVKSETGVCQRATNMDTYHVKSGDGVIKIR